MDLFRPADILDRPVIGPEWSERLSHRGHNLGFDTLFLRNKGPIAL